jgi:hypothetical protein
MKSVYNNLLYALVLFGTIFLMAYIDLRTELIAKQDYRVWKWIVIKSFLYIPVGFILAFPHFFQQLKNSGVWKIDYIKLLFLALPASYLTFYLPFHFLIPLNTINVPWFIVSGIELYKLGGTILGYVVLTSLYKTEDNNGLFK